MYWLKDEKQETSVHLHVCMMHNDGLYRMSDVDGISYNFGGETYFFSFLQQIYQTLIHVFFLEVTDYISLQSYTVIVPKPINQTLVVCSCWTLSPSSGSLLKPLRHKICVKFVLLAMKYLFIASWL